MKSFLCAMTAAWMLAMLPANSRAADTNLLGYGQDANQVESAPLTANILGTLLDRAGMPRLYEVALSPLQSPKQAPLLSLPPSEKQSPEQSPKLTDLLPRKASRHCSLIPGRTVRLARRTDRALSREGRPDAVLALTGRRVLEPAGLSTCTDGTCSAGGRRVTEVQGQTCGANGQCSGGGRGILHPFRR